MRYQENVLIESIQNYNVVIIVANLWPKTGFDV